jgi:hypothetical protein
VSRKIWQTWNRCFRGHSFDFMNEWLPYLSEAFFVFLICDWNVQMRKLRNLFFLVRWMLLFDGSVEFFHSNTIMSKNRPVDLQNCF